MNMWLLALLLSVTVASGPTLIEKPVDVTVDIGDSGYSVCTHTHLLKISPIEILIIQNYSDVKPR